MPYGIVNRPSLYDPEGLSEEEKNLWDLLRQFFGNAYQDAYSMGTGLTALAGEAVTLPYRAATGQINWEEVPGKAAEVGKGLLADLAEWKDPGKRIFEHPLFAAFDVATLAGGAGAALKGAGGLGKAGSLARAAEEFGTLGRTMAPLAAEEAGRGLMEIGRKGAQELAEDILRQAARRGAPAALDAGEEALAKMGLSAEAALPTTAKGMGEALMKAVAAGEAFAPQIEKQLLAQPGAGASSTLRKIGQAIDPADWGKTAGRVWEGLSGKDWWPSWLPTYQEWNLGNTIKQMLGGARAEQFLKRSDVFKQVEEAFKGLKPDEYNAFIKRGLFLEDLAPELAAKIDPIVEKVRALTEGAGQELVGAGKLGEESLLKGRWTPYAYAQKLWEPGQEWTPEIAAKAQELAGGRVPTYLPLRWEEELGKKGELFLKPGGEIPKPGWGKERVGYNIPKIHEAIQTPPAGSTAPRPAGLPAVATDPKELTKRYLTSVENVKIAEDLAQKIISHPKVIKADPAMVKRAMGSGYVPFYPEGFLQFYRGHVDLGKKVMGLFERASEEGATFSPELLEKLAGEAVEYMGVKKNPEVYLVPKQFAEELRKVAPERGNFRRYWDKMTDWWRASVLTFEPRWYVNELMGNLGFTALRGIAPENLGTALKEAGRVALKGEGEIIPKQLQHSGLIRGGEMYSANLGRAAATPVGAAIGAVESSLPGKVIGAVGKGLGEFNAKIEDFFRAANYTDAALKEARRQVMRETGDRYVSLEAALDRAKSFKESPAQIQALLDDIDQYIYNYQTKLSPFERQWMRTLFPFYGFYKHVAELMVKYPAMHPGKTAVLARLSDVGNRIQQQMVAESTGQPEGTEMPPWLRGAVPVGKTPGGEDLFFSARSMQPMQLPTEQSILPGLHPAITAGIEAFTGVDWFTKKPIRQENVIDVGGFKWEINEKTGQIEPIGIFIAPYMERLMRQVPQFKLINELVAPVTRYSTGVKEGTELESDVANRRRILEVLKNAGISIYETDVQGWVERMVKSREAAAKIWQNRRIEEEMQKAVQ